MDLRDIDRQIKELRREQGFYRHLGFGRELQDMQMVNLTDERRDAAERLGEVQRRMSLDTRAAPAWREWVLLPAGLAAVAARSIFARNRGVTTP